MHGLYVILFYLIESMELLFMFSFDVQFKEGKKWICLGTSLLILLITPIIAACINLFPEGTELAPWWFYMVTIACIIPIILWTKGNPVLNWLNLFVVGYVSITLLDFFVGIISGLFVENARPLRQEHELSALPNVLVFVLVAIIESILSLYIRFIWQRIVSRKWLGNILFLISLIPFSVIVFWDYTLENGLHARIHLTNGVLGLIAFPFTLFVTLLIYFLKENIEHKKALRLIDKKAKDTYEKHSQMTEMVKKVAIWRHDIRNHLDVMNSLLTDSENTGKAKEILKSTDRILGQSTELNIVEYSSSPILNSLLSSKQKKAKKNAIDLKYQISRDISINISDYDLISLCSNLLDNAIEACVKLPEGERFATFYLYEKKDYLCFDVMNTAKEVSFRTTKKDAKEHGYGMEIIASIAEKYHGYFNILPVSDADQTRPNLANQPMVHSFAVLKNGI